MKVKDIMAIGAVTAEASTQVRSAAQLMRREDVGMLVVASGSDITGVITDRDLFVGCIAAGHAAGACEVGRHMSTPAVTADASDEAEHAAGVMRRHRIRRLPVTDGKDLVGVVSFSDIAGSLRDTIHDVLAGIAAPSSGRSLRRIGTVRHFYTKLGVAVADLYQPLRRGDRACFLGHTTDFEQAIESLEIEHQQVDYATPGQAVAMKTASRVRPGDGVFVERN